MLAHRIARAVETVAAACGRIRAAEGEAIAARDALTDAQSRALRLLGEAMARHTGAEERRPLVGGSAA